MSVVKSTDYLGNFKTLSQRSWFFYLFPCLVFSIFGFKDLGLPGLYMDSVNPDYMAAWMQKGSLSIPAWIYPDNFLAGLYEYPLLNSLYGGNSTAYLAILFFKIFGFGAVEVRLFHSLLGIITLLATVWCLLKWRTPKFAVILFTTLLASDPSYIYAWRTQYYLQLYPIIWFFLGVGLLGGFFFDDKSNNNQKYTKALLAGSFIGFSAYSYFIFAIYAGSVAILFLLATRKQEIKSFFFLVAGIFIGFIPYIYAHVSIILNTDFSSYVNQIKGLQTAYGVVDTQQGGIIERLSTVISRLEQLVFGKGVESAIFGSSNEEALPSFLAVGFLSFFFIFYRPYYINSLKFSDEKQSSAQIYSSLLATLTSISILVHLVFGSIIGKPLGLQHYIMLIPLMYFLCAVLFSKISYIKLSASICKAVKLIAAILAIFIIVINIFASHRISNRLMSNGGNGLYSDAINTTGLYLKSLPPETALLFPQWGYWMGVVSITGSKYSVFEAPNLVEMEKRLRTDPELKKRSLFVLVLDQNYFQGKDLNIDPRELAERNGLRLSDITTIHGRNNIDKIKLLHLSRTEY